MRLPLGERCHRLVASSMLRARGSSSLELRMLLERFDSACIKPRLQVGIYEAVHDPMKLTLHNLTDIHSCGIRNKD